LQGVLPPEVMRNLYLTWTTSLASYYTYYTDSDAYWSAFAERYGTVPSPFEGADYPAGFGLASNGKVGVDCLLCHASRFEGKTLIGASNNRLDLRAFVEDVQRLPAAVAALKEQDLPEPYASLVAGLPDDQVPEPYASLEIPTGAAGLNDGFGLGLLTATFYAEPPPGLRTFMGYEDAPPWWTMKYKARLYTDGSAPGEGIYTMMSTLLAFGLTLDQLLAYLPTFRAIQSYVWSMPAPRWEDYELPPVDESKAARGATVFGERCASCHGAYDGDVFPTLCAPRASARWRPISSTPSSPRRTRRWSRRGSTSRRRSRGSSRARRTCTTGACRPCARCSCRRSAPRGGAAWARRSIPSPSGSPSKSSRRRPTATPSQVARWSIRP
jgi:mono/diheme cytochrome c family protein